jgi:hypothetical protein
MMKEITLKDLLKVLLRMNGTFVLSNELGSMEFRGDDLYLRPHKEWITIYHSQVKSPESRSHLHLKWQTLRSATIAREEGKTPHLAFYRSAEPVGQPLLIWYFPSFYDWGNNKAEIRENQAQYVEFVKTYGTAFKFIEPLPVKQDLSP